MAKEPRSLTGKVAVVTGGGRGIGKALAAALAREGALVAIGDVDGEAAERSAAELGAAVTGLPLDVTDLPGYSAFLDEVERRLGPIDVLVNNAGIMPVTPLVDEAEASITRQLEINLRAVIHGTQEAAKRMRPRGTGHIVNVASMAGRTGFPNLATYSATKHGVVGLSEAMHFELRGTGVEVSVVMPARGPDRALQGPSERPRREDGHAGGGRLGDRARAEGAPLRRVRPALGRPAGHARLGHAAAAARRLRPRAEGRPGGHPRRPAGAGGLRGARGGERTGRRARGRGAGAPGRRAERAHRRPSRSAASRRSSRRSARPGPPGGSGPHPPRGAGPAARARRRTARRSPGAARDRARPTGAGAAGGPRAARRASAARPRRRARPARAGSGAGRRARRPWRRRWGTARRRPPRPRRPGSV